MNSTNLQKKQVSKRKKVLNNIAVATAVAGITGVVTQTASESIEASAKFGIKQPILSKPPSFTGSAGGNRPVGSHSYIPGSFPGVGGINKPGTGGINANRPGTYPGASKPKPPSVVTGGSTSSKPSNTGNVTAPPKPGTSTNTGSNKPTAPPKPNGSLTGPGSKNPSNNQTDGGGLKKPETNKPTGDNGGLNKPGLDKPSLNKPGSGQTGNNDGAGKPSLNKPGSTQVGDKDGAGTSTGNKPGSTQDGDKDGVGTSTGNKPGSTQGGDKDGVGTSGGNDGGRKPSVNNKNLEEDTSSGGKGAINSQVNAATGGNKGDGYQKVGAIAGVVGIISTVAFLATSVYGIMQGQQSMEMQLQMQNDAIDNQLKFAEAEEDRQREQLAAQLGGVYNKEKLRIEFEDGSYYELLTGITRYPNGDWIDAQGNYHYADGSGSVDKDGNITVGGVGVVDPDGNLILGDGSGYYDPEGNFHPSGSSAQIKGFGNEDGYGGMYVDTGEGSLDVRNQSDNYGKKAYSSESHESEYNAAYSHYSVESGIFTAEEYSNVVHLIKSAKLNTPILELMAKEGEFSSEQVRVIAELLETYEKSGEI